MQYKYRQFIDPLPDCPPESSRPNETVAYRFVFEDMADDRNFVPAFILKPERREASTSNEICCSGYALSFFNSLQNAEAKYRKLRTTFKKIHQRIGTHIAEGNISKTDGVMTRITLEGHFDLHEFEGTDLRDKFKIVVKVYDGENSRL